jgi:RHS repeat-associated protein
LGAVLQFPRGDQQQHLRQQPDMASRIRVGNLRRLRNRITVSGASGAGNYTANGLNQYTAAGGAASLTYDTNGNLATGGGWTYTHNGDSRLISVSGATSAAFDSDGWNRCVKRTENGVTTYLIYDEWNLIAEYDASGTLVTHYIHGPREDEILAKVTTTSTTFPVEDAIGSTIAVTSASGAVLERIFYTDAFGTPAFQDASGTPLSGTSTDTRFLFTGREWLASLGLYDYRNRTYSPSLGRFIEADPIRLDGNDVNLYRYVGNNPVNLMDPTGLIIPLYPLVFPCFGRTRSNCEAKCGGASNVSWCLQGTQLTILPNGGYVRITAAVCKCKCPP